MSIYLVWSNRYRAWWADGGHGYVEDVWQAGRYSEADAASTCRTRTWERSAITPPEVMVLAPESDRDTFTVDDLRAMSDLMRTRAEESTAKAIAEREAAQQSGEAATR